MNVTLRDDIFWVGAVDWNLRDFHGYLTRRGTTYNAYLVRDEKTALIDTVKAAFANELICQVEGLGGLAKVDYIVVNHAEPDHAGGLSAAVRAMPNAQVVCDAKCRATLSSYHDTSKWNFRIVKEGDSLKLGRRSLSFVEVPMVHWPESMFTYCPEEKILFPNDAFGQHLATAERFDDEVPMDVIMEEARTYYANILMLYGSTISRALEKAAGLDIQIIAPSHGVIWRKNLGVILAAYKKWIALKCDPKVLVVYDTMWKSTEKMAECIVQGAASVPGVTVKQLYVRATGNTEIVTEVLEAAGIAFGSPTLNNTIMPAMGGLLTYLKGLRPHGKAGFAFGSYGWGKAAQVELHELLGGLKMTLLREPIQAQYCPTPEVLGECKQAGKQLAEKALEIAGRP